MGIEDPDQVYSMRAASGNTILFAAGTLNPVL